MVERLAGVRDERRRDRHRDAVGLDLEEDRAGDVPGGVAAGLEGGPDAARRERAGVRLALDEVLAGELGDGLAVAGRGQERVVLLGGGAGHRHEPVGVVGRAVGQRPLLHAVRDGVDDRRIERLVALDRPPQLLEDRLGQVLALGDLVEDVLAVDVGPGVLEVVLGLGDPVLGDLRDGVLSRSHGTPAVRRLCTSARHDACAKVAMSLPATRVAIQHRKSARSEVAGRSRRVVGSGRLADRDELVEQAPELAFDVDVAVRSPDDAEAPVGGDPRPDASARPVERDGDPGDEQGERDPDEPLARVGLGDQQA